MKAVVLVGGKATRLEPLTINVPKAMVPVINTPFLEYVIRNLAGHGFKEIILALGHMSQPIQDYFMDGSRFGAKLYYSMEDTPLGTAGATKKAEKYLGETFLVFNGDDFMDLDFAAMIDLHKTSGAKVTIALTRVDDPTNYGVVETDASSRVLHFTEKPKPEEVTSNMVNAGAWLVEPEVMSRIPPETQISFERTVFPEMLARHEPVYAYTSHGYWMDAGTPERYLLLHRDLLSGKSKQYIPARGLVVGEYTDIDPTARVTGQVVIGANCSIGARVKITGPAVIGDGSAILADSVIEYSVIWKNVRIESGVHLKESIVADSCHLISGSRGETVVLGANVTVPGNCLLETGSRIKPGTVANTKPAS